MVRNVAAHPHAELGYIYDVNQAAAEKLAAVTGAKVVSSPDDVWVRPMSMPW